MENEQIKTTADAGSFEEHVALRSVKPPEAAPVIEPKVEETPAPAEKPAEEPVAAGTQEETQEQKERKHRDRTAEGRISELTAGRKRAEEEAAELRKQLEMYRASKPAEPAAQPPRTEPSGKPKLKDFLDKPDMSYEDAQEAYTDAVFDWHGKQRREQEQQRKTADTINTKVAAARAKFSDFDEVTAGDARTGTGLVMSPPMQQFVVESEEGMRVLYHLGKNPEEYRSIMSMSPIRQFAALGRLEAVLQTPPAPEKPKPSVSRAPAPPRIVGGGEAHTAKTTSEATSFEEHERLRRAQLAR